MVSKGVVLCKGRKLGICLLMWVGWAPLSKANMPDSSDCSIPSLLLLLSES